MPDDIKEEPTEEPREPRKVGLQDGKQTPVYRVLQPVVLSTDRQCYMPGAILDLSHLPQESIRYFLDAKIFETADGEPANVPAKSAPPCRNC